RATAATATPRRAATSAMASAVAVVVAGAAATVTKIEKTARTTATPKAMMRNHRPRRTKTLIRIRKITLKRKIVLGSAGGGVDVAGIVVTKMTAKVSARAKTRP